MTALFSPGGVFKTPGVSDIPQEVLLSALKRHLSGDWGDVSEDDKQSNDEAVKDGDKSHLEAAGDDVGRYVIVPGQEVCHLKKTVESPEYARDQRGDADFLHPGRSLPGSKEQGDEEKGDDDHSDRSAGNKEGEQVCS